LKIKDYDNAMFQYEKALFIDSDNLNALQGKSLVFVGLGENEKAALTFQQIEVIKNTNSQKNNEIIDDNSVIETKIPGWIKTVFKWFSDDLISENEVIKGLQFLIEKGIIKIN